MDETMSQDVAFGSENREESEFMFDDSKETSPESLTNEGTVEKEPEEEAQRVPYSRFKRVVEDRDELEEKINFLQTQLEEIQSNRNEQTEIADMPAEWVELYGDSETSRKAWAIQQRREQELEEKAVIRAIERLQNREAEEAQRIEENEEIIDEEIENLQEAIGRKLTDKQEEEILSIVDEFSPTGPDGKYVTLFPFEKAYEIYTLRQSQKGLGTRQARQTVANLTNDGSDADADTGSSTFKRGWDNWRDAI